MFENNKHISVGEGNNGMLHLQKKKRGACRRQILEYLNDEKYDIDKGKCVTYVGHPQCNDREQGSTSRVLIFFCVLA